MQEIYKEDDITVSLLGFYSLLMSYVNVAINADDAGTWSSFSHFPDKPGESAPSTKGPMSQVLISSSRHTADFIIYIRSRSRTEA